MRALVEIIAFALVIVPVGFLPPWYSILIILLSWCWLFASQRDLLILKEVISSLEDNICASHSKKKTGVAAMWTGSGREALQRVNELRLQICSKVWGDFQSGNMVAGTSDFTPKNLGQNSSFLEAFLDDIRVNLNAQAAVVIIKAAGIEEEIYISVNKIEKLEKLVRCEARRVFSDEVRKEYWAYDLSSSKAGIWDLNSYKLRYAHVFFNEFDRNSQVQLWLAFCPMTPPNFTKFKEGRKVFSKLISLLRVRRVIESERGLARMAKRGEEETTEFLRSISHDIRSPLQNVKAILSILRSEDIDDEVKELCSSAEHNCQQLSYLMEDIVDVARFNSGELKARRYKVHLFDLLKSVCAMYTVPAKARGLELKMEIESSRGCFVVADISQLRRIFCNFLSNSLKYTSKGRIEIKISRTFSSELSVLIYDTGSGMSKEQLATLFDPFSRFNEGMAAGAGLGMAVTRMLADQNNIVLDVESCKGTGTTVTVGFREFFLPNNLETDTPENRALP